LIENICLIINTILGEMRDSEIPRVSFPLDNSIFKSYYNALDVYHNDIMYILVIYSSEMFNICWLYKNHLKLSMHLLGYATVTNPSFSGCIFFRSKSLTLFISIQTMQIESNRYRNTAEMTPPIVHRF